MYKINQRFNHGYGEFSLVEINGRDGVIRFSDTGYLKKIRLRDIGVKKFKDKMKPFVYGVGFIGDGKYKSKINGIRTHEYTKWVCMLRRCYSEDFHKNQKSYANCTVNPEWHNFQSFAEWYEDNYPRDGKSYELDKDIKIDGNRVYGPDTCIFVSKLQNVTRSRPAESKAKIRLKSPNGDVFVVSSINRFCRENNMPRRCIQRVVRGERESYNGWQLISPRVKVQGIST